MPETLQELCEDLRLSDMGVARFAPIWLVRPLVLGSSQDPGLRKGFEICKDGLASTRESQRINAMLLHQL